MNSLMTWLALLAVAMLPPGLSAEDWPQWRGPGRDGVSQEKGLLQAWPEGGPKLLWQVSDLGGGYSTPAVVGDRLYVLGNEGTDDEYVQARDVASGKVVWSTTIGKVGPNEGPQYPGSRSTPTVVGDVLYALGSDGDLACLEIKTGKVRWQKSLRKDFGGDPGKWAYAESPLVDGEALVCTPGGEEATMVALNRETGETLWKCAVPGGDEAAYASPIVVEAAGVQQYVTFLGKGLVGVDAKTGKFLWRYEKPAQGSQANIPTPVALGNLVYCGTGRGGGGLVEIKASGGRIMAEEVYSGSKLPTSIGGAVVVAGQLYGTNGEGLLCADFATGDVKWQERGIGAAAVCFADGRLYLHGEREGEVALVESTPEAYREHGRFSPPDQPERGSSRAWTYPVVANGKLYVRDLGMLWCYDVEAAK